MQSPCTVLKLLALILMMVAFPGCTTQHESDSPTEITYITETVIPSIEQLPTQTPKKTETSSLTSEFTVSPTTAPMLTPIPTLSEENRKKNLLELLSTNGGCDFPCWWGIHPGDPIEKALSLSPKLGEADLESGVNISYWISLADFKHTAFDIHYYVRDEIVIHIDVFLDHPWGGTDFQDVFNNRISLSSVLSRYGTPNDILLLVQPRAEKTASIIYTLTLIYETEGFSIEYLGRVDSENPIQICLSLNNFHLENIRFDLHDTQAMTSLRNRLPKQGYLPIEIVTTMSLDQFTENYSSGEIDCIETNIDFWN